MFYEPLAGWDGDSNLVPVLAAEIRASSDNDGLKGTACPSSGKAEAGREVARRCAVHADDVVFNWEYAKNPDTAAVRSATYKDIKVDKIDDHTVRVTFAEPTPFWADAFVGVNGMMIQNTCLPNMPGASRATRGKPEASRHEAPTFVDFKPGDIVLGKRNPTTSPTGRTSTRWRSKGRGITVSAARAMLQTGEYDYAWNMQVEDEILLKLRTAAGAVEMVSGGSVEFIMLNHADPNIEVDGERSSAKTKHPLFSDPAVREALNLLVDRVSVQKFIYGRTAVATGNFLSNPERYRSTRVSFEFNVDKANQVLEAAGWKKGADGIRAKDGKPLKFVFQTSINAPRQKNQAVFKQACQKAGIDVDSRSWPRVLLVRHRQSRYLRAFSCDAQMFTTNMQPDQRAS